MYIFIYVAYPQLTYLLPERGFISTVDPALDTSTIEIPP